MLPTIDSFYEFTVHTSRKEVVDHLNGGDGYWIKVLKHSSACMMHALHYLGGYVLRHLLCFCSLFYLHCQILYQSDINNVICT